MFEYMQLAPVDPILGLSDIIKLDTRSKKINLGIGVYKDKHGYTPILPSVKKAELLLLKNENTKNYLDIEGIHNFNYSTQQLLIQNNNDIFKHNRIQTVQTPGGTGALRIAADFLKQNTKAQRVWISKPGWINHKNIFTSSGFEILYYPYYNYHINNFDFNELFDNLSHARSEDIVILHGCCHNPTGIDFNSEQWKLLSQLSLKNNWLPLFDFAYQGFSTGLQEDMNGLNIFCKSHPELIICNSYSKNFNLYNERVGACTLIAQNEKIAKYSLSQIKCIIRSNYSNPPSHGASVVTTILNNNTLRSIWEDELQYMRTYIKKIRQLFVKTLHDKNEQKNFDFINKQNGMFAFTGLNKYQVQKLQKQAGIYMPNSGRINICGITENNVEYICENLLSVLIQTTKIT